MCRSTSALSLFVSIQFFPNYRITMTAHITHTPRGGNSDTMTPPALSHGLQSRTHLQTLKCLCHQDAYEGTRQWTHGLTSFLTITVLLGTKDILRFYFSTKKSLNPVNTITVKWSSDLLWLVGFVNKLLVMNEIIKWLDYQSNLSNDLITKGLDNQDHLSVWLSKDLV
jgi:hypothetical protein